MENQGLTDKEMFMKYPPSIVEWEMKHGITRYERNGMTYIACAKPFSEVCASINREERERRIRQYEKEQRGGQ